MPLDPQARSLLDAEAARGATPVHQLSVEQARHTVETGAPALFGPLDPVASVENRVVSGPLGGIPIRISTPVEARRPLPAVVYFHGGGWVVGSLDTHDGICRALARRSGSVVVAVDYRLAPEHRFPAAVEDAWAATSWVSAHAAELGADR